MSADGTTLRELQRLGQSPWLDNITRRALTDGSLARLVRAGEVTGLTSNPTIFEHAVSTTRDYDEALGRLVRAGRSVDAIVDALTIEDIQAVADVFKPVYQRTKRADGYVSLEISPDLANDTAATIREAARIWRAVNRPNVMVKIPATAAGVPAITATVAAGINVNVTLIFSIDRYRAVMQAYLDGLTRRLETGLAVDRIASVASFFVSRIDTVVDRMLDERIGGVSGERRTALEQLRGKAAIANAKLAYRTFRDTFGSEAFAVLARAGARPQRPLWASTSTKNPAYPDVYYVEALIGPNTVNTLPPQTLAAYRDHGHPENRLDLALDRAHAVLAQLEHLGIEMRRVTARLEADGVAAFATSWAQLKQVVESRREAVLVAERTAVHLGAHATAVAKAATAADEAQLTTRLFRKDATLWSPSGTEAGVAPLGWLAVEATPVADLARVAAFVDGLRADRVTHVLFCGMGGGALTAQLLRRTLGVAKGHPDLRVLDTVDPSAVAAAAAWGAPGRTLHLFASGSELGPDVESLFRVLWQRVATDRPGDRFAAITPAGSRLDALAAQHAFRAVFHLPADVSERFAALSYPGLLATALIGGDPARLLERAHRMLVACRAQVRADQNPGVSLGIILATLASRRLDKATLHAADRLHAFPEWLELLLAESTAKHGRGLVPIAGEPRAISSELGNDRLFVHLRASDPKAKPLAALARAGRPCVSIRLHDAYDLGGEFLRWQIATVVASHLLGVDPFDQPVTQAITRAAARLLEPQPPEPPFAAAAGGLGVDDADVVERLVAHLRPVRDAGHAAIHAVLAPTPRRDRLFLDLRVALRKRLGVTTTLGYGTRHLHALGQLAAAGPPPAATCILTADATDDLPVPGTAWTLAGVQHAYVLALEQALVAHQRPVLRLHLGSGVERALQRLTAAVQKVRTGAPARRSARATARRR